jgi:hypothetical protein
MLEREIRDRLFAVKEDALLINVRYLSDDRRR